MLFVQDRDALVEEEQQASTSGSSAGGGEQQQQQQRAVNGSGDFLSSLLSSTYTVQRPGEQPLVGSTHVLCQGLRLDALSGWLNKLAYACCM